MIAEILDMLRSRRSLLRAGGITVAGHVAVALVGLAAIRTFTELAPPAVFGEANLLLSVLALFISLFVAPFTNTQLRYHTAATERGEGDLFTAEVFSWTLLATGVVCLLGLLGYPLWRVLGGQSYGVLSFAAAAVWLFCTSVRNVAASRLHAERRQGRYVSVLVIEAGLMLALTAISLAVAPTTEAYLVGQALSMGMLVIPLGLMGGLKGAFKFKVRARADYPRRVLGYGAPFVPLAGLGFLANQADRYTLAFLLGPVAVGAYVAPFAIASRGMSLANASLNDLLRPILFDVVNRGDHQKAAQVFKIWVILRVVLSACALLALALLGDLIAQVLLAEEYREGAVAVMLWVAAAYALAGMSQTLETRILSLEHSSKLLAPLISGALGNLVLSLLLIPRNGILGAAQATCGSFAIQCIMTAVSLSRAHGHVSRRWVDA